ncbi:MAG: N-acetylmuramoyl-L-alanine amidase [Elusimicrobia bacterium]|nr:N-acetylmuramoyl-L-alanine amidase [Elusimicrobiota bacterium]
MFSLLSLFSALFSVSHAATPLPRDVPASSGTISIVYPPEGLSMGMASGEVIFGSVSHPKAPFRINGKSVKPHRQGGFIAFPPISPGTFTFHCELDLPGGTTAVTRTIYVAAPLVLSPPVPVRIDPEARQPASDLELRPGDWLTVQMKGSTGGKAEFSIAGQKRRFPMSESTAGLGIYQGVYQVRLEDAFDQGEIEFELKGADGTATAKAKGRLTVRDVPLVAVVRSSGAVSLKTFPGSGYLGFPPAGTRFLVSGRQGAETRVQLSPDLSAWIDTSAITFLPLGSLPPRAVLGTIRLQGSPEAAAATIGLTDNVAFQIEESSDLSSLSVRLFNTTGYTNWIVYDSEDSFVRQVRWRQEDTHTALVTFDLEPGRRLWGYRAHWEGGALRLELRKPPPFAPKGQSAFKGLAIVVDPGHQPGAHGAVGPRGLLEKDANLSVAKSLAQLLSQEGATPVLTRPGDDDVGLLERPRIAWDKRGDLFISVHHNAIPDGEDPLGRPRGYSVFYYQPHSFDLAKAVHRSYRRRIPLPDEGLRYGNLLVARMTEMPAILTESAYIILPDHEALLQSASFQRRLAKAMLEGARAFLEEAREREARAPKPVRIPAPEPEPAERAPKRAVRPNGPKPGKPKADMPKEPPPKASQQKPRRKRS